MDNKIFTCDFFTGLDLSLCLTFVLCGHSHNNENYEHIDMAFAEGMMEHHQMAVDMAEIIIKYGEDEQVKKLAENIIDTQKKEIEEMNNFLNS